MFFRSFLLSIVFHSGFSMYVAVLLHTSLNKKGTEIVHAESASFCRLVCSLSCCFISARKGTRIFGRNERCMQKSESLTQTTQNRSQSGNFTIQHDRMSQMCTEEETHKQKGGTDRTAPIRDAERSVYGALTKGNPQHETKDNETESIHKADSTAGYRKLGHSKHSA